MAKFLGRQYELKKLKELRQRAAPSFVVVKGRRRIGKTRLIKELAKEFNTYYAFEGAIPPRNIKGLDAKRNHQLSIFSAQFSAQFETRIDFKDWYSALKTLSQFLPKETASLVFFDEISWMASGATETFKSALKHFWDHQFPDIKGSMMVVAGSVSSWIEEHIVEDTGFYGRESLQLTLQPLDLKSAIQFWEDQYHTSTRDILKVLSVTGMIPKYLEQINPSKDAEQNIHDLCFDPSGYLFNEYNNIFYNIFGTRSKTYEKICRFLSQKQGASLAEIKTGIKNQSGDISKYLDDLALSGFIRQHTPWHIKSGLVSKRPLSNYSLVDPYIRFYLSYIEPRRDRVLNHTYEQRHIEQFTNWSTIAGLQFEVFIENNINLLFDSLGIHKSQIEHYGPYRIKTTKRNKTEPQLEPKTSTHAQIDMLIQSKSTLYVCEMKFRKKITNDAKEEVTKKLDILQREPGASSLNVRPVLVYAGELSEGLHSDDFFTKVCVDDWITET